MFLTKLREVIAGILIGSALVLLGWAYWLVPFEQRDVIVLPEHVNMQNRVSLLSGAARVTIQWPRWIRYGESAAVRVSVNAVDETVQVMIPSTGSEAIIESKLDLLGARLSPPGPITLHPSYGESLRFAWRLTPTTRQPVVGMAWVIVHLAGGAYPLAVEAISIRILSLGRFTQPQLLWIGWGGLVLGIVLAFPALEARLLTSWLRVTPRQEAG